MEEMRQRMDRGDADREVDEIIQVRAQWFFHGITLTFSSTQAMCDIAKDRAQKLEQPAKI